MSKDKSENYDEDSEGDDDSSSETEEDDSTLSNPYLEDGMTIDEMRESGLEDETNEG